MGSETEQHSISEAGKQTYFYDRIRAPFHGIVEAGWITFGLLIAIRVFEAPDEWKAAISSAGFFGLLINGFTLALASKTGKKTTNLISFYQLLTGICLIASAFSATLAIFLVLFLFAHIIFAQQAPLMIQIYATNYSPKERGTKLSTVFIIVAIGGIIFSVGGGELLDRNLDLYQEVLIVMGVACLLNAYLVRKIPSKPLVKAETSSPFRNLSLMWKDRLFGMMLTAWMLLGFGNLMIMPLRVEYVANPIYGINLSNTEVAFLTFTLPSVLRILSTKIWGILFDRMHFIIWRMCVNACFIISVLIYFNTQSMLWLIVGAAFDGIGKGGGMLGWNLWVTKIAPPDKVSAYMSVHTGLTGLRGTLAPFIGYTLIMEASPQTTSFISTGLMIISIAIFAFLIRSSRFSEGGLKY
ncbi:MFS transporter [Rubellicoccus peritrichatus]|uniref:MFS transporter n=1 Tax=Rubellicoccus peritrichatus TaxID=3080537 RepID=A0AAQ3LD78_9BACT|nr:MFS transporter [Puniceicoccus sp. CR14]WOO41413.1 MFS transporter [Puniceicoccus sp. CR14]